MGSTGIPVEPFIWGRNRLVCVKAPFYVECSCQEGSFHKG